jgi:hypothetical protein
MILVVMMTTTTTTTTMMMMIQWHSNPLPGLGRLIVRFLDHVEGLLGRVISSLQGGQAITHSADF